MALTPFRILILAAITVVLSVGGILLIVAGVHGPQLMTAIGGLLLLPNVIIARLGVPVGIPFLNSTSIISVLVFVLLQAAYYYALFRLISHVRS